MPRIDAHGLVVMGKAGGPLSVDGVQVNETGGCAQWIAPGVAICNARVGDRWRVATYDVLAKVLAPVSERGANELAAGGWRYAAWNSDVGVFGDVASVPDIRAGLSLTGDDMRGAAGEDGSIAVMPDRQRGLDPAILSASSEVTAVLRGVVRDLHVVDQRRAVWRDDDFGLRTVGQTVPVQCGPARTPRWIDLPGELAWVLYYSEAFGTVAHPIDDISQARILTPPGIDAFHPDARCIGGRIMACWSRGAGELPHELSVINDVRSLPVTDLSSHAPAGTAVEPFSQKLWAGYFWKYSDRHGDNSSAPGSCSFVDEPGALVRAAGPVVVDAALVSAARFRWESVVALWVSGGDPAVIESKAALAVAQVRGLQLASRPVIGYLDGPQPWSGFPVSSDWDGLQCYCDPSESVAACEARLLARLRAFDVLARIVLVVQAYDRNGTEHDEEKLDALQRLWERLARDRRVVMVLLFSDGRKGGTRDYERWRPTHAALMAVATPPPIGSAEPVPPARVAPLVTITSYDSSEDVGEPVLATAAVTAGRVDTFIWRYRPLGTGEWREAGRRPSSQAEFAFAFAEPGLYEVSLRGEGPDGAAETWKQRVVTVTRKQQEEPMPLPEREVQGVSFRTNDGEHVLCAEAAGAQRLNATRTDVGGWEQFTVVFVDRDRCALKAVNGRFVCAEGGGGRELITDRDSIGPWETFRIVDMSGGGVALQTNDGHYVRAESGGGGFVAADAPRPGFTEPGAWETFTPSASLTQAVRRAVSLTGRLVTDGTQVFRSTAGEAVRWKGVTAFKLLELFRRGEDVEPFIATFEALGFNVLRVFRYTPEKEWHAEAWEPADTPTTLAFLALAARHGFHVELVLLTDDDRGRTGPAREQVAELAQAKPENLLFEIGNEPQVHKDIDTAALRDACEASGFTYSSGDAGDGDRWFGRYVTHHSARDADWPRRAHDLLEFWSGDGPEQPHERRRCPAVSDEPIRPDQAGYVTTDFRAHAAACALLGAGATFHFESGKYGRLPTAEELACATAFAGGLDAFPPTVPLGPYDRPARWQPGSSRSYVVGGYAVRVRPETAAQPEPGWLALDEHGICWRRV